MKWEQEYRLKISPLPVQEKKLLLILPETKGAQYKGEVWSSFSCKGKMIIPMFPILLLQKVKAKTIFHPH